MGKKTEPTKSVDFLVKVGKKGVLTLPSAVRAAFNISPDDVLTFHVDVKRGVIEVVPQLLVKKSQAWFCTPEWQAGEREADEDIRAGRYEEMTPDGFLKEIGSHASEKVN